jgi:glycerol-3-phosphate dehydrogenase (NAD(P)+)
MAVLGAGSWGTALAVVLAHNGVPVRLWAHRGDHVAALAEERENRRYLPGVKLPDGLSVHDDLARALNGAGDVLVAVPSQAFRDSLELCRAHLPIGARIVWATKGLDAASGGLLHRVAERILPDRSLAVLSGPTFAREVAAGLPTAVAVASADEAFAADLATAFHNEAFRVSTSSDVAGVELGGAVKNVLAIATGVADGMGLGANARAGLITRGLAEISRLGASLGAQPRTFTGLAGMGDLILTCTDDQSRNRRMGLALGAGKDIATARAEISQTVEGLRTAEEVHQLAQRQGVEMPICEQVHRLLRGEITPAEATRNLMQREPKGEFE